MLLVNLGTPAAPTAAAVRTYLAEFLSDPKVIPIPRWLWLPVLHLVVLNTRPRRSAEKYRLVWTPEGSPLAVHTARQAKLLGEKTGWPVEYAMRYGEPSLKKFSRPSLIFPLYPQYSESATGSVLALAEGRPAIRDFHDHPAYIAALAALVRRHRRSPFLVMSFHGLPKRGGDEYQAQCHRTGELLAEKLSLKSDEWMVTFQSRFGAAEWLQPYTQPTLEELARKGIKEVDVFCPGFVADCLETLEEIAITAREAFVAAGGTELRMIPCLNEEPEWIAAMAEIASGSAARPYPDHAG
ncbi:MAG TPA: ferrochelatase [Burkholderiales bacterium]|nr:ferrochelatase [Burkholderiales bacterium]